MATAAPRSTPVAGDTRFFAIMAFVMCATIVAGFSLNLAMGRSTFAVPSVYHIHALIFMSWIGLYLAQHITITTGDIALHVRLGKLAYFWIPAMLGAGTALMIAVARRTGGPFFFDVNEFLVSNLALLACFCVLAFWALRQRRYTGWHRRLMLCAMTILTGPGLGRLLPMPLMIPNAWTLTCAATLIFPVIGMIADKRRCGRVHPAYWWGTGLYVGTFVLSMLIAYSPLGYAFTDWVIAGTPGAARPMQAFLPPGFAM
ncbi:hypothetical protein GRI58_02610 [Porphyrobacter algicida]|uniref:DUF2306 domain-containing protein n=1 Tax=Qipengyuania algicida TaxID=1836209 RepID=A0A845ADF7_9SPHN|nr:hypothetical protein [Qipengyuania algicida]MXP27714.1 hypothetical protein [Qipengyuania algicida]